MRKAEKDKWRETMGDRWRDSRRETEERKKDKVSKRRRGVLMWESQWDCGYIERTLCF